MRWALLLAAVLATANTGCAIPGLGTLVEKSVAELRGGHGESRELTPLPDGPSLDRFQRIRVLRVERSTDAGPMPATLPGVVESELRRAVDEANLVSGEKGPTLLIRTRLTTHWPAMGLSQALAAHSEILARVEFVEEGRRAPLGVYYVRGMSLAIARKSDEQLGKGLASAVVDLIGSRRTLPEKIAEEKIAEPPLTADR